MKKTPTYPSVSLSKRAARAIQHGHPWVFGETSGVCELGDLVNLKGPDGAQVGWGLSDEGAISFRALGRGVAPKGGLRSVILDRIGRADQFRFRHLPDNTDTYRIVSGAGDGLPGLVVDRYGAVAVLRLYSRAWERHIRDIIQAIERLPWVETVWRKWGVTRVDGKRGGELLAGAELPSRLIVIEEGIRYLVRPETGQKTGLFLDQRTHRSMVRRWAQGRIMANLFAYNGGFSVAGALGGASRVVTVDIAPDAIEDAKENFRLNGIDPNEHAFVVADAFEWKPADRQDMVVVDPPSLVKDKSQIPAGLRAYRNLHRRVGPWLPRDGLLATASCTSWINRAQWAQAIEEGLSTGGAWSWHWASAEPIDHPVALAHHEAHYLKFGLLRRR